MSAELERRLTNWITSREQMWISLKDSRLTRAEINDVAARYGKEVVHECADHTDRLLLIAEPGHRPRPEPCRWTTYKMTLTFPGLFGILTLAAILVADMLGYAEVAFGSAIVGILLGILSLFAPRALPRSMRVTLLAREFNGARVVIIPLVLYGLSPKLVSRLASAYGYRFQNQAAASVHGPYALYHARGG